MQILKSIENNLRAVPLKDLKAFRQLALWSCLCGISAFLISAVINGAIDHRLLGYADILKYKHLRYLVGYQMEDVPVELFVHFFVLEISFLLSLLFTTAFISRRLIENRGFAFLFLVFLTFETVAVPFYQLWWGQLGWTESEIWNTFSVMTIPLPCSLSYAFHLGLVFIVCRMRKFDAWKSLSLWTIFAPTASYFIAGILMMPLCQLLEASFH